MKIKSSQKKIALFMPAFAGGGAERVMLHLAEGFVGRGYNIDLVVTTRNGVLTSEIPEDINEINLDTSRIITSIFPFAKYLNEAQPNIILSALKPTNVVALISHKLARSKANIFVSEHSTFSSAQNNSSKIRECLFPFLLKILYPKADGIIAVSEGVKEDLEEQLGFSDKIITIYNPVVTPELKLKANESVDHDWFLSPDIKVIIGVGRLIQAKNFELLINAFKKIYLKNKNFRLIILGEGPKRSTLEKLVRNSRLQEVILMPGFVDNPYKYMAKADCFVLSSRWEGFGNVLVEAMACGTPVVGTDCPNGPREILEGGKWGRLVRPGDEEELKKAIVDNIKHPINGIENRAGDFSAEKSVFEYVDLFS